jgi:hypothetical protein
VADDDDWRVTISLDQADGAALLRHTFSVHEAETEVRHRLDGGVAVSGGDRQLFLYAATREAAAHAEQIAREVLAARGVQATFALHRWHPVAEEWQDPDASLPGSQAELQAERQRAEAAQTEESLAAGVALWEARAEFPTHREAVALADQLRAEGLPVIRRWKFLVVGAANADDAELLADRIRREAPPDATVVAQAAGARLPFYVFWPAR